MARTPTSAHRRSIALNRRIIPFGLVAILGAIPALFAILGAILAPAQLSALGSTDEPSLPGLPPLDDASGPIGPPAVSTLIRLDEGGVLATSQDGGSSWNPIDLSDTTNPSSYITAIAIDPAASNRWILGTSYDGIYVTSDSGATWTDITADTVIEPLYSGAGFYEEIAGIEFVPSAGSEPAETETKEVIIAAGLGGGFARLDLESMTATRLGPFRDSERAYASPASLFPHAGVLGIDNAGRTVAAARLGTSTHPGAHGRASVATAGKPATVADSTAAVQRRVAASGRSGIYIAAANATPDRMPTYYALAKRMGYNMIVVDFKDDLGFLTYETALDLPIAIGAVDPIVDAPQLISDAHERGLYVAARIVVFKDRSLHRYDDFRYALWDSERDRPWGVFRTETDEETKETRVVQVEHWVDPYLSAVWDYNIAIAEELIELGVDEIQFDYIRFPSDGEAENVVSRHAEPGASRVGALEGFLAAARERIRVPISVDVFGFNAWARMSYLGQDITRLAPYVDVICPMFYPSHFAERFLPWFDYFTRAWFIYSEGTRRAHLLAGDGTLIRPYVQAFLIGSELEYEQPEYFHYLDIQLSGIAAGRGDGYTLWNASGRYYMVK